jgi:hypothetical protein
MAVCALLVHSDASERIEGPEDRDGAGGAWKKKEVAPAQMNRKRHVCRYRSLGAGCAESAVFVFDLVYNARSMP